jgi:methanogenic corrinoid protein MtbC1
MERHHEPDQCVFSTSTEPGRRGLAAYAANELLAAHPETKAGFGPDPLSGWQNWLGSRLDELAAAVAAERPAIFTAQVQWAKAVLAARGFSTEHYRTSLQCLQSVLSRELPENVHSLAADYLARALEAFDDEPAELSTRLLPDTPEGRLASEYLLAVLQGDRRRASQLILDGVDQGQSVRDVHLRVLLPAQQEVGRMWLVGEINVAEEHFASATTKMVMAQLLPRAKFAPRNGKTMLAAAVAGNQHDIGLQTVADFFEMDGWRTIQLGANVPIGDLVQAVDCFEVDLLGLSASQATQFETLRETIAEVRQCERGDRVKILIGGFAFASAAGMPEELGADGLAADPVAAVQQGRQLVGLAR